MTAPVYVRLNVTISYDHRAGNYRALFSTTEIPAEVAKVEGNRSPFNAFVETPSDPVAERAQKLADAHITAFPTYTRAEAGCFLQGVTSGFNPKTGELWTLQDEEANTVVDTLCLMSLFLRKGVFGPDRKPVLVQWNDGEKRFIHEETDSIIRIPDPVLAPRAVTPATPRLSLP